MVSSSLILLLLSVLLFSAVVHPQGDSDETIEIFDTLCDKSNGLENELKKCLEFLSKNGKDLSGPLNVTEKNCDYDEFKNRLPFAFCLNTTEYEDENMDVECLYEIRNALKEIPNELTQKVTGACKATKDVLESIDWDEYYNESDYDSESSSDSDEDDSDEDSEGERDSEEDSENEE